MTYASLMVHLNLGRSNQNLLKITKTLAQRFDARVIGLAGGHPSQRVYVDGYAGSDVFAMETAEIDEFLAQAKAGFYDEFGPESASCTTEPHRAEWRSTNRYEFLSEFAACQARCADLVIKASLPPESSGESVAANTADLVLRAGRPVLLVPGEVEDARFDWVLVAWKDTREARRAIADALPLLKLARHVRVVEIAPHNELAYAQARLDDVVAWLKTHGVAAQAQPTLLNPDNNDQLGSIADECGAQLVVAGAYGHSRLREWVLGGVTRSLLQGSQRCCLLSH
jgi:nucleotide-binding universal stress UspA family protein